MLPGYFLTQPDAVLNLREDTAADCTRVQTVLTVLDPKEDAASPDPAPTFSVMQPVITAPDSDVIAFDSFRKDLLAIFGCKLTLCPFSIKQEAGLFLIIFLVTIGNSFFEIPEICRDPAPLPEPTAPIPRRPILFPGRDTRKEICCRRHRTAHPHFPPRPV